jgi:hypothetical protein
MSVIVLNKSERDQLTAPSPQQQFSVATDENDTHKATRILRDHEVWNDSFTYLANNKDLTEAKSDRAWIEVDFNWSWLSDPAKLRAWFDWKIRKTFRAICTCVADGENWFEPTFSNIIIDSRKREKSHENIFLTDRPIL